MMSAQVISKVALGRTSELQGAAHHPHLNKIRQTFAPARPWAYNVLFALTGECRHRLPSNAAVFPGIEDGVCTALNSLAAATDNKLPDTVLQVRRAGSNTRGK